MKKQAETKKPNILQSDFEWIHTQEEGWSGEAREDTILAKAVKDYVTANLIDHDGYSVLDGFRWKRYGDAYRVGHQCNFAERVPSLDVDIFYSYRSFQDCIKTAQNCSKLPNKLSELALLALADLREITLEGDYIYSPSSWHDKREHYCSVCLAGAVMVNTLHGDETGLICPIKFKEGDKLTALDRFRKGEIRRALDIFPSKEGFTIDKGEIEPIKELEEEIEFLGHRYLCNYFNEADKLEQAEITEISAKAKKRFRKIYY